MSDNNQNAAKHFDWAFLLFLVTITNVKIYIKAFAVVFYLLYIIYNKYKTAPQNGFSRFYFIMPVIGTIGAYLHGSFDVQGYWFGYMFGVINWLIAGIAAYFLLVAIINLPRHKLLATIKVFFLLNTLVSIGELGKMIIDSGQLVPYWYWEPTEYYGGSTGDHILGVSANISVNNAALNSIGVIFFLLNKELKWAAMCMVILLLCTSNTTLILTCATLIGIMIVVNKAQIRKYSLVLLAIVGIIYPILSLDNIKYVDRVYSDEVTISKKGKQKSLEEKVTTKEIIDIAHFELNDTAGLTQYNVDKFYRLPLTDTLISHKDDLKYIQQFGSARSLSNDNLRLEPQYLQNLLVKWYGKPYKQLPLSKYDGIKKFYTLKQTLHYLKQSNKNLLFGAGIGNFSSRLAIKTTGLGIQGDYPYEYIYISDDYLHYHLFSFIYLFSMPISEHSIINMVNSIYNQVAGEYGLIGCLVFLLFYVGYLVRHVFILRKGKYLVALMMVFFLFEYWFEMISLTVIFELFILFEIFAREHDTTEG